MFALVVQRSAQGLAVDQPLQGHVLIAPIVGIAVYAPAQGQMVENDLVIMVLQEYSPDAAKDPSPFVHC